MLEGNSWVFFLIRYEFMGVGLFALIRLGCFGKTIRKVC